MRIDVLAIGSRGDVQPYVALGLGLRAAGHDVRLVTLGGFEELVRSRRLDHLSIGAEPQRIADTAAGRDWIADRTSVLGFLRGFVRVAEPLIASGIASYWRACQDVEAIVASPSGLLVGAHVAERLRVPLIRSQLAPRHDWAGRATLLTGARATWGALLGGLFGFAIWNRLRRTTNEARRDVLGLPPLSAGGPLTMLERQRVPLLDAYSEAVVPRPAHWGDWIHVTGYWFLDRSEQWVPPAPLVDFLGAGPPPVAVGFGSTPFPQPASAADLIVQALSRAGRRGLVISGGTGLPVGRLSDGVLSIDSVPHDWLFSQVGAVVHHGGAGVTGAALRAGRPAVVVPVFADQPFWAERVFALGAGPRPIPARRLTAEGLANAIQLTSSREMRDRAAALGERIRAEDGVKCAVDAIHRHVGHDEPRAMPLACSVR